VAVPSFGSGSSGAGATLAIWTVRSPSQAWGWLATLYGDARDNGSAAGSNSSLTVLFGPGIRWYGPLHGDVTSFVETSLRGYFQRNAVSSNGGTLYQKRWQAGAEGRVGIGAEWFPFERMSLGATVGGAVFVGWGGGQPGVPVRELRMNTFLTALRMSIYF
jgi:hypothetical protein